MVIAVRCRSYVCTIYHSQCIDGAYLIAGGTVVDGALLFLTSNVLWHWETHAVFPCHLCVIASECVLNAGFGG